MPATSTQTNRTKKKFNKTKFFRLALITLLAFLLVGYPAISVYGAFVFTTSPMRGVNPDLTPAQYGMTFQDVTFQTTENDKISLRGWFIPRQNSQRVLILVHAKDGTRTLMLDLSYQLWQAGFNILMFDTRGQGQSGGEHYSFGQHEQKDVVGAVNFVEGKGFQAAHIGLVGWSMGGATAIMAMSQTSEVRAAVTDSAYADFQRLAQERFTITTGLPQFFFPGIQLAAQLFVKVDVGQSQPVAAIKRVQHHLFLIQGDQDDTVPVRDFRELVQAGGPNVVESWLVPGGEHIRSFNSN